jgi:hypothetical protein
MANHILCDINRYKFFPIMNRDGVADHLWDHG